MSWKLAEWRWRDELRMYKSRRDLKRDVAPSTTRAQIAEEQTPHKHNITRLEFTNTERSRLLSSGPLDSLRSASYDRTLSKQDQHFVSISSFIPKPLSITSPPLYVRDVQGIKERYPAALSGTGYFSCTAGEFTPTHQRLEEPKALVNNLDIIDSQDDSVDDCSNDIVAVIDSHLNRFHQARAKSQLINLLEGRTESNLSILQPLLASSESEIPETPSSGSDPSEIGEEPSVWEASGERSSHPATLSRTALISSRPNTFAFGNSLFLEDAIFSLLNAWSARQEYKIVADDPSFQFDLLSLAGKHQSDVITSTTFDGMSGGEDPFSGFLKGKRRPTPPQTLFPDLFSAHASITSRPTSGNGGTPEDNIARVVLGPNDIPLKPLRARPERDEADTISEIISEYQGPQGLSKPSAGHEKGNIHHQSSPQRKLFGVVRDNTSRQFPQLINRSSLGSHRGKIVDESEASTTNYTKKRVRYLLPIETSVVDTGSSSEQSPLVGGSLKRVNAVLDLTALNRNKGNDPETSTATEHRILPKLPSNAASQRRELAATTKKSVTNVSKQSTRMIEPTREPQSSPALESSSLFPHDVDPPITEPSGLFLSDQVSSHSSLPTMGKGKGRAKDWLPASAVNDNFPKNNSQKALATQFTKLASFNPTACMDPDGEAMFPMDEEIDQFAQSTSTGPVMSRESEEQPALNTGGTRNLTGFGVDGQTGIETSDGKEIGRPERRFLNENNLPELNTFSFVNRLPPLSDGKCTEVMIRKRLDTVTDDWKRLKHVCPQFPLREEHLNVPHPYKEGRAKYERLQTLENGDWLEQGYCNYHKRAEFSGTKGLEAGALVGHMAQSQHRAGRLVVWVGCLVFPVGGFLVLKDMYQNGGLAAAMMQWASKDWRIVHPHPDERRLARLMFEVMIGVWSLVVVGVFAVCAWALTKLV